MSNSAFDSYESILFASNSLKGLNALIRARTNAILVGEKLHEWIVLGRFCLTSDGKIKKYAKGESPAELYPHFPRVISKAEFCKYLSQFDEHCEVGPLTTLNVHLPKENDTCPLCKKGWTADNCHDVIYNLPGGFHSACYKIYQEKTEKAYFNALVTQSGFRNIQLMLATPNPYCPSEVCPPWFKIVADGVIFTIGNWRGRLIIIICENDRVDFTEICSECDVTKGRDYIHAWSREQAVQVLRKVHDLTSFPQLPTRTIEDIKKEFEEDHNID